MCRSGIRAALLAAVTVTGPAAFPARASAQATRAIAPLSFLTIGVAVK
ncbi:hypothetical protein [Gemmatimonas sp.]